MTRRAQQTRNRRVVRQPDRIQTRLLLWVLGAGAVVLVPLLANVWGHAESVRLGYAIEQARQEKTDLAETNRLLRAEVASQRDLDRIQRVATEELGLRPRRPEDTVVVNEVAPQDGDDPSTEPRMVAVAAEGEAP